MKHRNLLMIPGPVEVDPEVLAALGMPPVSHVGADFIEVFGSALEQLRQVFLSTDGQPFILAGSGTLAMDSAAANLIQPGDAALVVNTGYFSDRFAAILQRYGAQVTQVGAPPGDRPSLEQVEAALQGAAFKCMTVTQVDTSTGVLADVQGLAGLARRYDVLLIVDGVCSVGGEALNMSEWGVDVALTASQKAIGCPPGLALLVASSRAVAAFRARQLPVQSYYADWNNWLPIMQSYEARKPAYFATPAVNLVAALNVSLKQILQEGMAARVARHAALSRACKAGIAALGLKQLPASSEIAAHTMTAPFYPAGVSGAEFLAQAAQAGVLLAGGLHPALRTQYFRIGHIGAVTRADILATLAAVESALAAGGYPFDPGVSLSAAQRVGRGQ